jgi:hypothetical protein
MCCHDASHRVQWADVGTTAYFYTRGILTRKNKVIDSFTWGERLTLQTGRLDQPDWTAPRRAQRLAQKNEPNRDCRID